MQRFTTISAIEKYWTLCTKIGGNAIGNHIKTVAENSWVAKYFNDIFFDVASINSDTLWSFACQ